MCGRFTITVDLNDLKAYLSDTFDMHQLKTDFIVPRYNVAPGQDVIAILNDGHEYRAGLIKWGLIPSYAKDAYSAVKIINAKSETLLSKKVFIDSFKHKRCAILADGFYEWFKENNSKQPMRITLKNQKLFLMAALWSSYENKDGTKLYTATIITTTANSLVSNIHERMPVILDDASKDLWLNPNETDDHLLSQLLKPYDATLMTYYPVSDRVNKTAYDDPSCVERITFEKQTTTLL